MNRSGETILSLSDEDLSQAGIDPASITDDQFDYLVEQMRKYFADSFSQALSEAIDTVSR
jgi:hypothetical protein